MGGRKALQRKLKAILRVLSSCQAAARKLQNISLCVLPAINCQLRRSACMQIHQHFFCTRMDMAVDDQEGGRHLSVVEVRSFSGLLL